MKFLIAVIAGLALLSAALPGRAATGSAEGTWLSADGGTRVQIVNCGGKLCGKVVWLHVPNDPATGQPKTDKHNPDQAKRARPLLGLTVVQGMAPDGDGRWSGQIYNADDGNTYQAHVKVLSDSTMQVQGCVLGILCKGQIWTRVT